MNAALEVAEKLGISLTPEEKEKVFWGDYQPLFDAIRQARSDELESLSQFRNSFKQVAYTLQVLILHAEKLQAMFQTGMIGDEYRKPLEKMFLAIKMSAKYFSEAVHENN